MGSIVDKISDMEKEYPVLCVHFKEKQKKDWIKHYFELEKRNHELHNNK
jgi:hypothetical protein